MPDPASLIQKLESLFEDLQRQVATETGEWSVKGFIDVYRRIYSISSDTKVLSKIIELMMFPILYDFAKYEGYEVVLAGHQNHYPDLSLIASDGTRFALDIKTTYRNPSGGYVNGITLGTFTGYFRRRAETPNITYPYGSYHAHLVLGVIYSRVPYAEERLSYSIEQLTDIPSVAQSSRFFVHHKYRIASDRPGSGNTRNIGSVTAEDVLVNGTGPFAVLGEDVFDDYWMFYLTQDMVRAAELPGPPYRNLKEYLEYKRGYVE